MAWLDNILFGPVENAIELEVNPMAMSFDFGLIKLTQRNLLGDLKKSIIKNTVPLVRINANYLTIEQLNIFNGFLGYPSGFFAFITRDDWSMTLQKTMSTSVSTVPIPQSSITKLDAARVALGAGGLITPTGVFENAGGTGTNFYTSGAYDDDTQTIILGSNLSSSVREVWITYTYTGWLVDIDKISASIQAGWLDRFSYDFVLTGV